MIQLVHRATGGTVRHVCAFGRPAGNLFSWRLYDQAGALKASADDVPSGAPASTALSSASKRGDRSLRSVDSLAGDWRSILIQPLNYGDAGSLRSFSLPFQIGDDPQDLILFDPLPVDVKAGDQIDVDEVKVALAPAVTAGLDAGVYIFEVISTDERGDEHREVERLAITSANLVQPVTYSAFIRRYPALADQARPEDPAFSVVLTTGLELVLDELEAMGVNWWSLRTWGQLGPAIAGRAAGLELAAMGPEFEAMAEAVRKEADEALRGISSRLLWADTDGDGTPAGDARLPRVNKVWVNR